MPNRTAASPGPLRVVCASNGRYPPHADGYCEQATERALFDRLKLHAELPEAIPFRADEMVTQVPTRVDEFIAQTEALWTAPRGNRLLRVDLRHEKAAGWMVGAIKQRYSSAVVHPVVPIYAALQASPGWLARRMNLPEANA